jgi:arginine repressor
MSAQERRIIRTLEREGAKTLAELLTALPAADTRTRRTQAASLSRSLRRLSVRGVVERRDRLRYAMRTNG